jgi:ribonuclease J
VVTVVLSVDTATGLLTSGPKIVSSGFMEQAQVVHLFEALGVEIEAAISKKPEMLDDRESTKSQVRELTRKFLYNETHRRPMVIPVVLEI